MSWPKITADPATWPPYKSLVTAAYRHKPDYGAERVLFVSGEIVAVEPHTYWDKESGSWDFDELVTLTIKSEGNMRKILAIAWHPIPPLDGE